MKRRLEPNENYHPLQHYRFVIQYRHPRHGWILRESDRDLSVFALWQRAIRMGWEVGSLQGIYDRQLKTWVKPQIKSTIDNRTTDTTDTTDPKEGA